MFVLHHASAHSIRRGLRSVTLEKGGKWPNEYPSAPLTHSHQILLCPEVDQQIAIAATFSRGRQRKRSASSTVAHAYEEMLVYDVDNSSVSIEGFDN